jgi:cysteine desulfurase
MKEIYLDNSATTRVSKEVVAVMNKAMITDYGNPSSNHELGEKARAEIDDVRKKIAKEINASPGEIYFTSGGTESNNVAILGLAKANPSKKTIVISSIEHPSIIEPCNYLKSQRYNIVRIGVDSEGLIKIYDLEKVLKDNKDVLLVSVMHVNNIIGTIQNINDIGTICKKRGVIFHTDAVQSFGKIDIDVRKMGIGMLSASGHKINGPKGVGFVYIKSGIKIEPLVYGGEQERGLRSGTENVPGILGLGKALEMMKKIDKKKIGKVRDEFINELEKIGGKLNGSRENRIYNNVNMRFDSNSENVISWLSSRGIYVSSGSACESKKEKEDATLKAIGLSGREIRGSIRIVVNGEIEIRDIGRIVREIKNAIKIKA